MWKSNGELAGNIPVRPPKQNVAMNPEDHTIGVSKVSFPRQSVPIQLKNFTPVGTAMSIVITAKNGNSTLPVVYMWWAHTVTDNPAMAKVANTRPLYPKIGLREKTGRISVTIPKKGSAMM